MLRLDFTGNDIFDPLLLRSILANDVDDKATVATVYITGRFHREKVIAAEGDTVDAHEEELRGKGILFAALK